MDQCSQHDTPPAFSVVLTNRSGHALRLELEVQNVLVLTDRRFVRIPEFSNTQSGVFVHVPQRSKAAHRPTLS